MASPPSLQAATVQAVALQTAAAQVRDNRATDGPQLAALATDANSPLPPAEFNRKSDGPQLTAHAVG
jgi:hypothetical protein